METSFASNTRTVTTMNESGFISTTFVPFPQTIPVAVAIAKENSMYHDFENDETHGFARDYAARRFDEVNEEHKEKIDRHFHITDDERPTSPKELVKRIEDKKYIFVDEKNAGEEGTLSRYSSIDSVLRWRDPAAKEDKAGAKAAHAKREKAYDHGMDSVHMRDPADFERALHSFEDATFH